MIFTNSRTESQSTLLMTTTHQSSDKCDHSARTSASESKITNSHPSNINLSCSKSGPASQTLVLLGQGSKPSVSVFTRANVHAAD